MIIKLNIKNIENDREELMAQYIRETIDGFMEVVTTIFELEEYEEEDME